MPPTTCISLLHPVRIVAQDGTQPPRPLYDTVRAAWTAWLACCGERSLVLSTFLHESFPPHHPRALIHPHSTRCRPTSVQSTPFHASNFRLSFLCPVSSAIPHPEPPLIRAPRTRALPLSLPSCLRPMPFLMYRHSSSLPIRTLLFCQPFYLSLSFLRFLCNFLSCAFYPSCIPARDPHFTSNSLYYPSSTITAFPHTVIVSHHRRNLTLASPLLSIFHLPRLPY